MFSSEINTRDLYFSNPLDHFLGSENDMRPSYESGFSSSCSAFRNSGNSGEKQLKNSQDLFSQTQKSDLAGSQFGTCNTDYQKYISQNLLLGKGDGSPHSYLSFKPNRSEQKKEKADLPQNDESKVLLKELKESVAFLTDCIKKVNNAQENDRLQRLEEEISKLVDKISRIDESHEKCFERMKENCRSISKHQIEENSSLKNMSSSVAEIRETVEYLHNNFEDHLENNSKKTSENIKKIIKNNDYFFKDKLEDIQVLLRKLDDCMEKSSRSNEILLNSIEMRIEKKMESNFNDIKVLITNAFTEAQNTNQVSPQRVFAPKYRRLDQDIPDRRLYELNRNIYESNSEYMTPRLQNCQDISNQNNNFMHKKFPIRPLSKATAPPLAKYVHERGKTDKKRLNPYATRSKTRNQPQKFDAKEQYTNINVKRKVATPLATSPTENYSIQRARNHVCTPLLRTLHSNSVHSQLVSARQKAETSKPSYNISSQIELSMNSSPGLTVYEATTLARQYEIHTHQLR